MARALLYRDIIETSSRHHLLLSDPEAARSTMKHAWKSAWNSARVVSVTLCCLLASAPATGQRRYYSMADLKALERSGSWAELLEHIEDIKPSERGAPWRSLLAKAARSWLEQPGISTNPQRAVALSAALLRRFPRLRRDKDLMGRRNKVGMRAFRSCFAVPRRAEWCEKHLRGFVKQDPDNTTLAMKAGKLVRRSMRHHVAVHYFHQALFSGGKAAREARARRCADEDLKLSVVSAISLHPGTRDREIRLARALAFGPCWSRLRQPLVDRVATDENARKNACRGLLDKGALSTVRKKKCQRVAR
jgi:hypothetical protein